MKHIGLIELNEALGVQALGCIKELGVAFDKCDINDSAISIGHPIGCTGTRITHTLTMQMKKKGVNPDLASLYIGGGGIMSTVLETV